ncbi:L-fuconolactonase [Kaistia hirudinis]|uniref:L-fuconolactonase n=1 Tax=Kaistia hirudinis TaxID=1293440 RepID=A0A840AK55_9HYPH|nr:amidohydrolase family protein [Kaistia hirudinis]MBB3929673.1 L-fuconolactonase [Kaistia hirudinis]
MPEFPIIDSHVHLYDVQRLSYGWLANVPKIDRSFDLADFDAARGPVDVEKLVFAEVAVDPGLHIDEAEFIQHMADADPRLAASVAHAPLEKGARVEADLEKLAALPTVRGIRRLIETERDPSFVLAPGFLEGLRLLPKFGFTFDICVKHWALTYGIELARRCPEVSFVLDHIGKPDIKNGLREPWWSQMVELAALPNVVCKISGVITEADHQTWKAEDVKPYVAHAIEVFGFDRVMYGSDWTVSELTHRYPDWVAILDDVVAGASESERRKLYRDTVTRVYRL